MVRIQRTLPSVCCFALLIISGCQQQSTTDYQEFSAIPENPSEESVDEKTTTDAENNASEHTPTQPTLQVTEAENGNTAPENVAEAIAFEPLVAVKPVFGQSSGELKANIDNKTSISVEQREIKLLVDEPDFRKEEGAVRVSYDDLDLLKVLNMESVPVDAVSHFPGWMTALDGEKVRIRGFMYPPFRETGIDFFVLARDNQICCFGRNPKVYDLINVEMRDGVTTNYILNRPFDVVGTFHIRPETDGEEIFGLYELTDAVVIDK